MTPLQRYQGIVRDIELLLQERAFRYFMTRYAGEASGDLKVQCDTITVLLQQWLMPHVMWFENEEERQCTSGALLSIDLDETVTEASNAHDQ